MPSFTSSKKKHFARLAAALHPDSHVIYTWSQQGSTPVTVPAGQDWIIISAVNADNIALNNQGAYSNWNVREPDVLHPYVVPGGTVLQMFNHYVPQEHGEQIWTIQPELLWANDSRYYDDPEELFYQRIEAIRAAPLIRTYATVYGGTPFSNAAAVQPIEPLDWVNSPAPEGSDRSWGIVKKTGMMYGSWTVLAGSDSNNAWVGAALLSEIDDTHRMSFDREFILPFPRKTAACPTGFTGMKFAGGSRLDPNSAEIAAGATTDPAPRANGGIHWSIGPSLTGY
jgi:hypothetical protein